VRRAAGGAAIVGRASGPPLGIVEKPCYFDETHRFGSGDVMVLMTDGIVEAVETDLAEMPTLTALVAQGGGGSAVHRRVLAQLTGARRREPDDMTLLSLELLPDVTAVSSRRPSQQFLPCAS